MPVYQCNACQGMFTSPQGGQTVYHQCPPLSVPELIAAHDNGTQAFPPGQTALIAQAKVERKPKPITGEVDDGPASATLRRLSITRTGHVDQNLIDGVLQKDPTQPVDQVSPGAGVTQVSP